MKKQKIVITGGLGYIGTELCKLYSGESRFKDIVVIDSRFVSERVNQLSEWGIRFIQASILDEEVLEKELNDSDVIFHLAGITDVAYVKTQENVEKDNEIKRIGVEGTRNIIKYSSKNTRIVFPSTHVVYEGFEETRENIIEDEPVKPILTYSTTKVDSEIDFSKSDRDFVILRLASVYGYSTDTMRIGIMPNLFSKITSQNGTIKLFSGGVQLKSLVNLIDVVRCMKFVAEKEGKYVSRETFHLSNENMTVKEVALLCKKHNDNLNVIETDDEIPNLGYTISNKKLLDIGFEFKHNIEDAIKEMVSNWSFKSKPKDLEYIIKGGNEYVDERGSIYNYELTEPINLIGTITSKKGTVRANHYHPIQEQKCLLVKGKYISVIKDLSNPKSNVETRVINEGDIAVIQPNVAHTMVFLEDSIFLNLVRGEREHENYGITHTFPYELVDDNFKDKIMKTYKSECRSCGNEHLTQILSLGLSPLANNLSKSENEDADMYPLDLNYCDKCNNVQLSHVVPPEILFDNYLYVSSTTESFRKHFSDAAKKYMDRFNLSEKSTVVDIGSNDGIGLIPFKKMGVNVLGVEPAKNIAEIATNNGIKTLNAYFDDNVAETLIAVELNADLVMASNVFAHADDLKGIAQNAFKILKEDGTFVFEVQYFLDTINDLTFDNVYHEHVNYWTVTSLANFFQNLNLKVVDVEHINTHGGSIRVYVQKDGVVSNNVEEFLNNEFECGLLNLETYKGFSDRVLETKTNVLNNIQKLKDLGYTLVGYGSPAKATTALNFYGITNEDIEFIIEDNELKHGKYLPNTGIPIVSKQNINQSTIVIVLAWNFFDVIKENNKELVEKGIPFISIKDLTNEKMLNEEKIVEELHKY
jgi:nucleoside-diphosphate-sugar epimerase/SAM-dependent methyltransferase/dTDP-4-dehydrorhamnose 3,5-epimerase-like enzyme